MKIRLPYMIQDQLTADVKGLDPIQSFIWSSETYQHEDFLDGPVCSRVAILDFDEADGSLHAPIDLDRAGAEAAYVVNQDPSDRSFQSVSAFATVLKTLNLYESPDVLGRRIRWAFDGPQLLVVPRAGTWKNAYYERGSHSLQFFSFPGGDRSSMIHTSLSHDIVSHEAGHAILDAIAPHLYDCMTPQSLGLHEAIGDLTALFGSLESRVLRGQLLDQTDGDIRGINAYTQVAEEFGMYTGRDGALRSLWNDMTLAGADDPNDFHDLSQVLTGAVYRLLVDYYDQEWLELSGGGRPDFRKSGQALWQASQAMERFSLRGLDYLPPGEISFADYGRAVIAADAVSNPDYPWFRERFAEILAPRLDVPASSLAFTEPPGDLFGGPVELDGLRTSDWHAYHFAENHRRELHVPDAVPIQVEPRLAVTKRAFRSGGRADYHETVLKVSWEEIERGTRDRWVRFGTTAVFDESGNPAALVTSNPAVTGETHAAERDAFVELLLDRDLASTTDPTADVDATLDRGALRIAGTGHRLHANQAPGAPVPAREDR